MATPLIRPAPIAAAAATLLLCLSPALATKPMYAGVDQLPAPASITLLHKAAPQLDLPALQAAVKAAWGVELAVLDALGRAPAGIAEMPGEGAVRQFELRHSDITMLIWVSSEPLDRTNVLLDLRHPFMPAVGGTLPGSVGPLLANNGWISVDVTNAPRDSLGPQWTLVARLTAELADAAKPMGIYVGAVQEAAMWQPAMAWCLRQPNPVNQLFPYRFLPMPRLLEAESMPGYIQTALEQAKKTPSGADALVEPPPEPPPMPRGRQDRRVQPPAGPPGGSNPQRAPAGQRPRPAATPASPTPADPPQPAPPPGKGKPPSDEQADAEPTAAYIPASGWVLIRLADPGCEPELAWVQIKRPAGPDGRWIGVMMHDAQDHPHLEFMKDVFFRPEAVLDWTNLGPDCRNGNFIVRAIAEHEHPPNAKPD